MTAAHKAFLSPEQAVELLADHYRLTAAVEPLYGYLDQNFAVMTPRARYVLKIAGDASDEKRRQIDFQLALLGHLAGRPTGVQCPAPVPGHSGRLAGKAAGHHGMEHYFWLLTWVEGGLLDEIPRYDDGLLSSLGHAVGQVDHALLGFSHPGEEREFVWDLRRVGDLRPLTGHLRGRARRATVEFFLDHLEALVLPKLDGFRSSVIHNDGGNQHNMLVTKAADGQGRVTGIIDFGDALRTATVCGLAIAVAYATFGSPTPVHALERVVAGYHRVLPLEEEEVLALPWLVAGRLVTTVCMAARRAVEQPEDEYASVSAESAWRTLEQLEDLDLDREAARLLRSLE